MSKKTKYIRELKNCKLIIGNGFDLSCGLKTSYSDFFQDNAKLYNNLIRALEISFRKAKILKSIKHGKCNFQSIEKDIGSFSPFNIWDCFFAISFESNNNGVLWCDIEAEMKNSLYESDSQRTCFWERVFEQLKDDNIYSSTKECICCIFLTSRVNTSEYQNLYDFYEYLLKELNNFEKRFGEFIKNQIDETYIRKAKELIRRISLEINSIDSFNYTSFGYDKNFKNINGDIKDLDSKYWSTIFGIDSTNINPNMPEYIFTKAYRRLMVETTRTDADEMCDFNNVIIYGHSLNKQDYNYFFPIFDSLKLNDPIEKNKLVILYKVYDQTAKQKNIRKMVTNLSAMLVAYDKYINNRSEHRLMEMLIAENRILICDIKEFEN